MIRDRVILFIMVMMDRFVVCRMIVVVLNGCVI